MEDDNSHFARNTILTLPEMQFSPELQSSPCQKKTFLTLPEISYKPCLNVDVQFTWPEFQLQIFKKQNFSLAKTQMATGLNVMQLGIGLSLPLSKL